MFEARTDSAEQTQRLGREFARLLKEKDLVLLEGELGGGKTTFLKGVLKGLGSRARVLSPTFTLIRHYRAKRFQINHVDLYRLSGLDEALTAGLGDYLSADKSITFIEWGEKIEKELPKFWKIVFTYTGSHSRKITFTRKEQRYKT